MSAHLHPEECFLAELTDKTRAAGGRGGLAGDQVVSIAAAEGGFGETLGRGAVAFDKERRKALSARLITEAIDEIFGRKLVCRVGLIA